MLMMSHRQSEVNLAMGGRFVFLNLKKLVIFVLTIIIMDNVTQIHRSIPTKPEAMGLPTRMLIEFNYHLLTVWWRL